MIQIVQRHFFVDSVCCPRGLGLSDIFANSGLSLRWFKCAAGQLGTLSAKGLGNLRKKSQFQHVSTTLLISTQSGFL